MNIDPMTMKIVPTEEAGDRVVIHDATKHDPTTAFALARLSEDGQGPTPIGVFRAIDAPAYDQMLHRQLDEARQRKGEGSLRSLLEGGNVWDVA